MEAKLAPAPTGASFFPFEVNNDRESIVANIRAAAKRGLPELKQCPFTETPVLIVAGGPSVKAKLPIIRQLAKDCMILSVNGAYPFLRQHGIESDYFLLLDSRAGNVCHVEAPHEGTNHLLASQVHPDVFNRLLDYQVTLWHAGTEACIEQFKGQDKDFVSVPIGMASLYAIDVAAALGHRNQLLFGYDYSHESSDRYAYEQAMNKDDSVIEVHLDGKTYRTTASLARTADQFTAAIMPVIRGADLNIRVCSEGLLPAMLRYAMNPPTADSEREKYEQIWEIDAYRKVSPALEYVADAVRLLKIPQGADILDLGCGTGRSTKWFIDHGFDATGVDIVSNALEEDVPFIQQTLWDELPECDYAFSTDVLEHIPPEKVRPTLKRIYESCKVGCYLNVDTIPDAFGVMIGKRLHLTVMNADDWEHELKEFWPTVERVETTDKQAIFVCRR